MIKRRKELLALFVIFCVVSTGIGNRVFSMQRENEYAEASENADSKTGMETESETETEIETETESEMETESETETENETGTAAKTEGGIETEADTEMESGSEVETETENETGIETETEIGTEAETETEAEIETEMEIETEAGTEPETETGGEVEIETETEIRTETETGEPETEIEKETKEETEEKTEAETESRMETETYTEMASEEDTTAVQTETTAQTETAAQTETTAQTEKVTQTETATQTETLAQTETTAQTETAAQTEEENTVHTEKTIRTEDGVQTEKSKQTEKTEQSGTDKDASEQIKRGVQYEVKGDADAWYRDGQGLLWLKAGTSLYVEPKSGSGYNTGSCLENVKADGTFTFSLKKVNKGGEVVNESAVCQENYCVDGEAPAAKFQISGIKQGEIVYAPSSCTVQINIEPDGKSGLKSSSYKIIPCDRDGGVSDTSEASSWKDCSSAASVKITTEGLFRVYVKTEDMVGNTAFSGSSVICVDGTQPEITISGVGDQTANSGEVCLRVSCSDSGYKYGSLCVSINGVNQGKTPAVSKSDDFENGAWVEYCDFPKLKSYDDVYEVSVTAEDLSGNIAEKTIQFSINRFGSVYDLSAETKTLLEQYFLSDADNVVFYETNIDYIGESCIYCRHDGALRKLTGGSDYQVTMEGSETSWKRYCYTIPADFFSQEGVYEFLLMSGDLAKNTSDTGIQQKRVAFVLDWTAPACTVSGIQEGGIYEESMTFYVTPYDNIGLNGLKIYRNSELYFENTEQPGSGETIQITLEKDRDWKTVQIWLCDMSGNEYWSDEIPVFVGSADYEEVPAYRKARKSAKELIMENADRENIGDDLQENETEEVAMTRVSAVENGTGGNTDTDQDRESENERKHMANQQLSGTAASSTGGSEILTEGRRRTAGKLLLFAGFLAFLITVISLYRIRGGKRFK